MSSLVVLFCTRQKDSVEIQSRFYSDYHCLFGKMLQQTCFCSKEAVFCFVTPTLTHLFPTWGHCIKAVTTTLSYYQWWACQLNSYLHIKQTRNNISIQLSTWCNIHFSFGSVLVSTCSWGEYLACLAAKSFASELILVKTAACCGHKQCWSVRVNQNSKLKDTKC